jgi:Tol biopolymer transport system component
VLFFVRDGQSFATAFDADRLVVIGEPVIVDERVLTSTNAGSFLSVSHNGSAVYVVGNDDARTLTWVDRDGRTQPTGAPAGRYMMPRVSPDGSRVAVTIGAQAVGDVQIYDFRTQVTTQLTQDDRSEGTVEWSPDGSRVMFGSKRDGPLNLYIQQADASSTAERLLPHEREQWTGTWLRDGDTLTFIQNQPIADIRTMRVSDRQPRNVIDRPGRQWGARVSPDERWLAYMSDESGSFEIFVTTFPTPSRRWQVSAGGGGELVWSPTSRELYFRQGPRMMSVPIDPATDPPISQAMVRFDGAFFYLPNIPGLPNYDVAPDGRFLMISGAGTPPGEVEVGVGWVQHLAARLAQRR